MAKPPKKGRRKRKEKNFEVHESADLSTPLFSASFLNDVDGFVDGIPFDTIKDLIEQGALDAIQFAIPWDELEKQMIEGNVKEELVRNLQRTAAKTSANTVAIIREGLGVQTDLTFDANNPRVKRFIETRTARMVKNISDSGKKAIQDIIARQSSQPTSIDKVVTELKNVIGLRPDQVKAVDNFRKGLEAKGLNEKTVDSKTKAFARKQLGHRAATVARTEMMTAANQGHQLGWEQARDEGLFSQDEVEVVWVTAEDELVCPTCRPMNGVARSFDGTWEVKIRTSKGDVKGTRSLTIPNESHPNCRCTHQLVFK